MVCEYLSEVCGRQRVALPYLFWFREKLTTSCNTFNITRLWQPPTVSLKKVLMPDLWSEDSIWGEDSQNHGMISARLTHFSDFLRLWPCGSEVCIRQGRSGLFIWSNMGEERLNNLAILSIERKTLDKLDLDQLIMDFARMKVRRVSLVKWTQNFISSRNLLSFQITCWDEGLAEGRRIRDRTERHLGTVRTCQMRQGWGKWFSQLE